MTFNKLQRLCISLLDSPPKLFSFLLLASGHTFFPNSLLFFKTTFFVTNLNLNFYLSGKFILSTLKIVIKKLGNNSLLLYPVISNSVCTVFSYYRYRYLCIL